MTWRRGWGGTVSALSLVGAVPRMGAFGLALAVLLCAALVLNPYIGAVGGQAEPAAPVVLTAHVIQDLKFSVLQRINRDRISAGAPPVSFSSDLSTLADQHCREMLLENYSSHWNRAGLKPYMRYSWGGITDHTAENISSVVGLEVVRSRQGLNDEVMRRHEGMMAETPPADLHRQSILNPLHTHVGIGVAFDRDGVKLVEVFADRYVRVDPLPPKAPLSARLQVRGKPLARSHRVEAISIFYEPLPSERSVEELNVPSSYGYPDDELVLRPRISFPYTYADGSSGQIDIASDGSFVCTLNFFRKQPGVYTVVVWLKAEEGRPFMAADLSILVQS